MYSMSVNEIIKTLEQLLQAADSRSSCVDPIVFDWRGNTYNLSYNAANVPEGQYYKNGKKTTLTTVKNLYRKMRTETEA